MRSEQVQPTEYMTKQEQRTQMLHTEKNETDDSAVSVPRVAV